MNNNDSVLNNEYWELKIRTDDNKNYIYELFSKKNNKLYADQEYHYRVITSKKKGLRYLYLNHLNAEYKAKTLGERQIQLIDNEKLVIEGIFRETDLKITHEFELKDSSKWLKEYISLKNQGKKKVKIGLINFGFKKAFFRQYKGWVDHLDKYSLTAIPTRRFIHYGKDRKKKNFSASDLLFNAWA
ncbi:MAG: hypothetical protein ACFFAO_19110, partial [Candidatus Hermodarchaeota archaeon]